MKKALILLPIAAVLFSSGCMCGKMATWPVPGRAQIVAVKVYHSSVDPSPESRTIAYAGDLSPAGIAKVTEYLRGARQLRGRHAYVFCQYYLDVVTNDGRTTRLGVVWEQATATTKSSVAIDCSYPDPSKLSAREWHSLARNNDRRAQKGLLEAVQGLQ